MSKIQLLNIDCMEYMKTLPDKAFDLAIVDPPYGIGESKKKRENNITEKWKRPPKKIHNPKDWDKEPPPAEYFVELMRISKHQIIWGANYYPEMLKPSMGWVFWDKLNGDSDFSDGELAYTSMNKGLRKFTHLWNGFQKGEPEVRIHPTQKPVKLYKWLLSNYAKPEMKILDTHLGSGSSAIAAHYFGCDFVGCEIDTDYYQAAVARFGRETAQIDMFGGGL